MKDLRFKIILDSLVDRGVAQAKSAFSGLKTLGSNLMNVKAGFDLLAQAARAAWTVISASFQFERYNSQFKVLFGNLELARAHMAELAAFSAATPFELPEIARASRNLLTLTGSVLGATDSLRLVGDAAAATNNSLEDVATWVGRAYSAIASGRPFGEAAMRLSEMGILSGTARSKIEQLTEAGANNTEVWAVLQKELERYSGGMGELAKTGEGILSTLKDNWNLALAEVGAAAQDSAKNGIGALSTALEDLRKSGDLAAWSSATVKYLGKVGSLAGKVASGLFEVWKYTPVGMAVRVNAAGEKAQAKIGALVKAPMSANTRNALLEGLAEKPLAKRIANDLAKKQAEADAAREAKAVEEAKGRLAKAQEAFDKENATPEGRLNQLYSRLDSERTGRGKLTKESQILGSRERELAIVGEIVELESKLAREKQEAEERSARERLEAAEKVAREEERIARERLEAEERIQRKRVGDEVAAGRKTLSKYSITESEIEGVLGRATSKAQQLWAEWRNPSLRTARLKEEGDEAAARAEYERVVKDARMVELTRGMLTERQKQALEYSQALEAQKRAADALEAIRKNTADLNEKIERLLQMKD